jgi:hypothetical protein
VTDIIEHVSRSNNRRRLPNRRNATTFDIFHDSHRFVCTASLLNGRVVECFLTSSKSGTTLEALSSDIAIILSISFQTSLTVKALSHSVKRLPDGRPSSLVGCVLDALAALEAEVRS